MPDNTIGGPASATLQQLEVSRQREREQAQNETNSNTAQVQPQQNASVDVEVELSQEARELSLSTVQQLGAPTQTAETQAAQTENPGQTLEEDNEREDTRPPPRENESQVTRQFDRSANESLGTVIDIRS
ncbi:hypothetical protein BTA51_08530 [Hahella sp. CCB-MM4]|uniref:hypothetical protein n=1 Tax=Hahella sp. (strain CCB-MM4) TaxID=1926491 RepID=UPI000B9ADD73|nr:hypothetical protein [Hahella sp. CCB-MM4]OZG73833.1 hypothetical protein BTA51_08530 [Hahella sp. CCB-MM4]